VQKGKDVVRFELVAAFQEVQLDDESQASDLGSERSRQLRGRLSRASGREEVVDDQNALTLFDRILMNFKRVAAAGPKMKPRASMPRMRSTCLPM
jgi:hypothetical protein